MTREDAIEWLTNEKWTNANNKYKREWNEAFDMAIEALSTTNTENVSNYGDNDVRSRCEVDAKYQSDDLISRADAMGAVQDHFNADGFKGYDDGQQMMDRINALPSAEAVQRWIPCSERLPKERQEVYVTVYFIEGDTGRAYGYFDGFGKWHLYSTVEGTLNSGYEVIAWMPLPTPYKGGDD